MQAIRSGKLEVNEKFTQLTSFFKGGTFVQQCGSSVEEIFECCSIVAFLNQVNTGTN